MRYFRDMGWIRSLRDLKGEHLSTMRARLLNTVIVLSVVAVSIVGCTSVDDVVGSGLIPDNQTMVIKMDTLYGIKTYQALADSMESSRSGIGLIGSFVSPFYGRISSSALLQYIVNDFYIDEGFFGKEPPIFDSLKLEMTFLGVIGDTIANANLEQTFIIYEMNNPLEDSTSYYTTINPDDYTAYNPLFQFTLKGGVDTDDDGGKVVFQLASEEHILEGGRAFIDHLFAMDTTIYDEGKIPESLFVEDYNGLYIASKNDNPANALIYKIDLATTLLKLYFRRQEGGTVKDTSYVYYGFGDDFDLYRSNSANAIRYDYAGTQIEDLLVRDTVTTSPTSSITYELALVGLTPYLRFTDEFVESLKALQGHNSHMVINKASMEVFLNDPAPSLMDAAPSNLDMYYSFVENIPIPDLDYPPDYTGETLYGGWLRRAHGSYLMDITSYIQQLLNGNEEQRTVFLSTKYSYDLANSKEYWYSWKDAAIAGYDSEHPIRLVVTYTLIK